jgi:hypothetical protein
MDIDHIEWMMKDALIVCKKEELDDSILLPLVILHDVGYAKVPKSNPFNLTLRRAHMAEGAKIAREILVKIKYPADKIERIVYFVSVHDNWAFGDVDIYKKNKILAVFSDLDFTWMATPKGFLAVMNILEKDKKEMLKYLTSRKSPAKGQPFSCNTTKELYKKYLQDRKKEIMPKKDSELIKKK